MLDAFHDGPHQALVDSNIREVLAQFAIEWKCLSQSNEGTDR
jgi:hypothetical protein